MHLHHKTYLILLFLLACFQSLAHAQNGVKLYGYFQSVSPGIISKEQSNNEKLFNYFMYLSSSNKSRLYPVEAWIKGKRVGLTYELTKTPVIKFKDEGVVQNPEKIILVPSTTSKVYQLTGTSIVDGKNFSKAKTLSSSNELVVVYKLNGKFYYATLKKLSELEAANMQ